MVAIRVDHARAPERCAFCHDAGREPLVPCGACATGLHGECWTLAMGACPTLGCAGSAAAPPPVRDPPAPIVRLEWRRWARGAAAAALLAGAVLAVAPDPVTPAAPRPTTPVEARQRLTALGAEYARTIDFYFDRAREGPPPRVEHRYVEAPVRHVVFPLPSSRDALVWSPAGAGGAFPGWEEREPLGGGWWLVSP